MNYVIRPARLSDAESLLVLTMNGIQDWSAPIRTLLIPWIEETCNLEYIEKRFGNDDYHVFVAEQDDVILGTIYLNTSNSERAYVGGLYLSDKQKGIGTGLLRHLLEYANGKSCKIVDCDIYEGNELAIKLTEKHGAVKTGILVYDEVNYFVYTFTL